MTALCRLRLALEFKLDPVPCGPGQGPTFSIPRTWGATSSSLTVESSGAGRLEQSLIHGHSTLGGCRRPMLDAPWEKRDVRGAPLPVTSEGSGLPRAAPPGQPRSLTSGRRNGSAHSDGAGCPLEGDEAAGGWGLGAARGHLVRLLSVKVGPHRDTGCGSMQTCLMLTRTGHR